jgi:hypothetical protein
MHMRTRAFLTLTAAALVGVASARAEYRQIDLTIFGMD